MRDGIQAQRGRDITAGHHSVLQVSLRGLMGPANPEVPLIDPPGGVAYLCFVPVAGQFGRHQRHCASPGIAAICRTDPATE